MKNIGVCAKNINVARNFLNALVSERTIGDLVTINGYFGGIWEYVFVDTTYKIISYMGKGRGMQVDRLYLCNDVDADFKEEIVPRILRGENAEKTPVYFSQECYI